MTRLLKFIPMAVMLIAAVFATGAAVSAQKGAGCGPGNLRCTDNVADANGYWQSSSPNIYYAQISPFRGTFKFQPHGGGPAITGHETVVNIQLAGTFGFGFGCFIVPDSAFVISNDVQTATLNTTLTADETCPGFGQSVIAGPGPGPAGFQPGGGIPLPLGISVTWTGPGATWTSTSDTMTHCTGLTETMHFSDDSSQARATGVLTLPDTSTIDLGTTQFAFVEQFQQALNQSGQPAPQCLIS